MMNMIFIYDSSEIVLGVWLMPYAMQLSIEFNSQLTVVLLTQQRLYVTDYQIMQIFVTIT